jgi:hypothetical protein
VRVNKNNTNENLIDLFERVHSTLYRGGVGVEYTVDQRFT